MQQGLLQNEGGAPAAGEEGQLRRSVSGRSILKSGEGPVVSPQSPRQPFADNLSKPLEDVNHIPDRLDDCGSVVADPRHDRSMTL